MVTSFNKLTCPDANIFIHSSITTDNPYKYCKKYFIDLKDSRTLKGLLLATVRKRLDYWLLGLPGAIKYFFTYCKNKRLAPKVYLQIIISDKTVNRRIKTYSNVIGNILAQKIDENKINDVARELRVNINSKFQIFTKVPNFIIENNIDVGYKKRVFDELKILANNFSDEEDSEHLALLKHFINQKNVTETIIFLTEDSGLNGIAGQVLSWSSNLISIKTCESFFGNP